MTGIYKLTSPNNKSYIGKSTNIFQRWEQHKAVSHTKSTKLYKSIKKYGWDNFKKEIIKECKVEELDNLEIFYIKKYNSVEKGLNLTYGGDGGKKSDETKIKISKSMVGKNNWSKGGYHTKPVLQYSLNGKLIKKWDSCIEAELALNITTINQAASNKIKTSGGYIWIYENNFLSSLLENKILEANTHKGKGKSKSNLHKKKINTKERAKNISKGRMKPILQYSKDNIFIKEWDSIQLASKELGINSSSICSNLNKKYKHAGGYIFKRK